MENNKQLYEKIGNEYKEVFPLNFIENIVDKVSGKTLAEIIASYNNIYVPYKGTAEATRNAIPVLLRRRGLWISYNVGDKSITEKYIGTTEDVTSNWGNDDNWEKIPDVSLVQVEAGKLPDGIITPSKLSPALQQLINEHKTIYNLPDDEDLEEVNGVIRFKDREYNPLLDNSKGYKILRRNWVGGKNVLTQDMINNVNTIYEIRYDFDLNGKEITIPEGCVLDFKGGSLSNGILSGNNYYINSFLKKIFYNIKFKGYNALNYRYNLSWFVEKTVDGIYDNVNIDSSIEINFAFNNTNIRNFIIPSNVFYYLKHPIVIIGDINTYSDGGWYKSNSAHYAKERECCIYSNEIITLLEYNYITKNIKENFILEGFNFFCRKKDDNLIYKETPIVKINSVTKENVSGNIWGLIFNCNITSIMNKIKIYEEDDGSAIFSYVPSYTGLYLEAKSASFTFIKVDGYIQQVYLGINTSNNFNINKKAWLTELTINADTRCVYGGNFKGVNGGPTTIFGAHQPINAFKRFDELQVLGYFIGEWVNLYGFVWDTDVEKPGIDGKGKVTTIKYPVLIDSNNYNNGILNDFNLRYLNKNDMIKSPIIRSQLNDIVLYEKNLLNNIENSDITNLSYTIKEKNTNDVLDLLKHNKIKVYNSHVLFGEYLNGSKNNFRINTSNDVPFIYNTSNETINAIIEINFDIKFSSYVPAQSVFKMCYKSFTDSTLIVTKTHIKNNTVIEYINKQLLADVFYQNNSCLTINNLCDNAYNTNVKIIFEINMANNTFLGLPFVYIPSIVHKERINCGNSKNRPNFYVNTHNGFYYFDTTVGKPIWYNKNKWVDKDGNPIDSLKQGTTQQRPTDVKAGFYYFDTTLNMPIWKKDDTSEDWIDATGAKV